MFALETLTLLLSQCCPQKVEDLSCSNFVVNSIDSLYIPSNKSLASVYKNPSIDLSVKGISASCTGKYHATGGAGGQISLTAVSSAEDQPAIHLTSEFVSSYDTPNSTSQNTSKYWIPRALTTRQCQANLKISALHCHGSASAEVVNLFSRIIKSSVSSQLNGILCPKIQEAVDPLATDTILAAIRALSKYIPGSSIDPNKSIRSADMGTTLPTPAEANKQSAALINFAKDAPILVHSLLSVNHFLDCFYSTSTNLTVFEDKKNPKGHSCMGVVTRGLKGLVSTLVESLAEEVHVPIPKAMHKIDFELPTYGRVLLDIRDLHITGVDQLDGLSILSPVMKEEPILSDFGSRIRTGAAGVNVTADVNITVFPIPGGIIHGDPLHEAFHVHLNVSTLDASGTVGLALKRDQFNEIQIGTIMDSLPSIFHHTNSSHNASVNRRCLLDSIQALYVKDMEMQTLLVESATVVPRFQNKSIRRRRRLSPLTEELEKDLDGVINRVMMLLLGEYQPLLTDSAAGFVQTALVAKINTWIEKELHTTTVAAVLGGRRVAIPTLSATTDPFPISEGVCSGDERQTGAKLVNFTSLAFLEKLNQYVNKPSSLASINHAIDNLAAKLERHHNKMTSEITTLLLGLQKSVTPGVSVKLRDVRIDNLGSFDHIDVLSPELDGLHLKNGFNMAVTKHETATHGGGSSPRVHVSIDVLYRPRNLSGTLNATISLGDIYLDGGSILRFDMARLRRLSLVELFSEGHCVIAPFQEHRIYNNHNVSRLGSLVANASVRVLGDSNFQNFTTFMDTTMYPVAASLITALVGWTMNTLQATLNSAATSSFGQAEGYCTGSQKFGFDDDPPILSDDFTDELLFPVLCVFGAVFVTAQAIFLFGRRHWGLPRENDTFRYVESASCFASPNSIHSLLIHSHSDDATSIEPQLQFENEEHEFGVEGDNKDGGTGPGETLVHSTVLSAFSRQAVPVFIVGTIVLLLSSNISSGATVDLDVAWNEKREINLPAMFTFSLLNTARDMWQAGIYPLFFLVLIMSGIWPYAKLLLMLVAWISPTTLLKPRTRERLLLALDALGKFALIDFLLFVLMMVAFRYHLDVTETLSLDVYVSPETGFYSFLAATCISLVLGHFLVYCHRQSEMRHLSPRQSALHLQESVLHHSYIVGYTNEGEHRLKLSRRFRGFLLFATAFAALLLSIGISLKSFKFEIGGIAGDMLGDHSTSRYSLVSLGASLRRSVKDPSVGIAVLQVTYYFYAVVMPFVCLSLLVVLLLCPLTLPTQRRVLAMAEIANAWSAIEVFVIAIIASLLEISTFASFIVGDRCDLISKILKEYFESTIKDDSDATCFTVRSSVEDSSWVLVMGALVNSMIVSILLRFAHLSVTERIQSEMESTLGQSSDDALRPDESDGPGTIAGLLSYGCCRGLVFEDAPSPGRSYGYIPQSADTYSVAPDVDWEDESTLNGAHHPSSGRPHEPTTAIVLQTIQDAFD